MTLGLGTLYFRHVAGAWDLFSWVDPAQAGHVSGTEYEVNRRRHLQGKRT